MAGIAECLVESDRSLSTVLMVPAGRLATAKCGIVAERCSAPLGWPSPFKLLPSAGVLKQNVFTIERSLLTMISMSDGYIAYVTQFGKSVNC